MVVRESDVWSSKFQVVRLYDEWADEVGRNRLKINEPETSSWRWQRAMTRRALVRSRRKRTSFVRPLYDQQGRRRTAGPYTSRLIGCGQEKAVSRSKNENEN